MIRAPHGSNFNDPNFTQALSGLLQTEIPAIPQSGASAAPHGSNFNDPGLQQALSGLLQTEIPAMPQQDGGSAPHGSNFNDPAYQQAISGIVQTQADPPTAIHLVKNSLNGGELAPDMDCRFDIPRYQNGCEKLLNMVPLPTGGITKRPGFRHIINLGGEINAGSTRCRLFPFVYSAKLAWMWLIYWRAGQGCLLQKISRDGDSNPVTIATLPYSNREINEVSMCQVGAVVYFAHPNHKPFKLKVSSQSGFLEQDTPEYLDFKISMPAPAIVSAEFEGEGANGTTKTRYVATAVHEDTGEESLPCEEFEIEHSIFASGCTITITLEGVENASEYRIYKRKGGTYGFIGRVIDMENPVFIDDNIAADTADTPPVEFTGFDAPGDYPSIVFIHQQRLGFAASDHDPLTIWMSQTSNFESMGAKQPPNDDDAIEVTLASSQANKILWAVPDRSGLAIGTEGGEWYLTGASGETSISPNSLSFQPQTNYGSETGIPPVRCASSLIFCQRGGRQVRDMGYSFQSDRYEATDLTLLSKHLFRFAKVKSWAWQDAPASILWICLHSGQLLGLTYLPEHEVTAWHKHSTPNGKFENCAVLQDSNGLYRLWAIIARETSSGLQYRLEMLDKFYEGQPDEWDAGVEEIPLPVHADGAEYAAFKARCIPCLPETGLQAGSSAMRVKRIAGIKAKVINSKPFEYFVKSQNTGDSKTMPVPFSGAGYVDEADWSCPIDAGFRDGAKVELVFDGKDPVTVLGLSIQMEIASEAGGQA